MNRRTALVLMLLTGICCSCGKATPETLVTNNFDEKEMDAAIARARSEVDAFIEELKKGADKDYSVKVPIEDKGKTEHFWLTDIAYRDGEFEGKIGNDPGIVTNVKFDQKWTVKKDAISDWMFMRDDKIHGNYTLRPLLKTMPKDEAEKIRSMLATP